MTDPDGSTINPDISLHTAALLLSAPTFCLRLYLHPTSDKSNSSLLISNHRATGRLILVTAPEENRDEVDRHTFRKTRMNLFFSSPGAVCSQPVQLLITALKCCLSTRGRSKYGYWCFHCSPWCRLSLIPDAVKCSGPSRSARSHSKHIAACRTGRDDSCFSYIVSLKMLKRRQDESFCDVLLTFTCDVWCHSDVLTGSKLNFF